MWLIRLRGAARAASSPPERAEPTLSLRKPRTSFLSSRTRRAPGATEGSQSGVSAQSRAAAQAGEGPRAGATCRGAGGRSSATAAARNCGCSGRSDGSDTRRSYPQPPQASAEGHPGDSSTDVRPAFNPAPGFGHHHEMDPQRADLRSPAAWAAVTIGPLRLAVAWERQGDRAGRCRQSPARAFTGRTLCRPYVGTRPRCSHRGCGRC